MLICRGSITWLQFYTLRHIVCSLLGYCCRSWGVTSVLTCVSWALAPHSWERSCLFQPLTRITLSVWRSSCEAAGIQSSPSLPSAEAAQEMSGQLWHVWHVDEVLAASGTFTFTFQVMSSSRNDEYKKKMFLEKMLHSGHSVKWLTRFGQR